MSNGTMLQKDVPGIPEPVTSLEPLPPKDEITNLKQSGVTKVEANSLFASAKYSSAIQLYEKALAQCPNYLEFEIAVLRANIAACSLKLSDWQNTIESATSCLQCLGRIDQTQENLNKALSENLDDAEKEELVDVSNADEDISVQDPEILSKTTHTHAEIQRLKAKALMRRAKARVEAGGWANLQGAEEDYKTLVTIDELGPIDRKIVVREMHSIPQRLEQAKAKEMGEMMGKLKDLGNGILKPFGLSTDNFNFVQDPTSGGYSMQFNQSNAKSS